MATGDLSAAGEQLAQLAAEATRLGLQDGPGLISRLRVHLLQVSVGPSALDTLSDLPHIRARLHPQAQPGLLAWTAVIDVRAGRRDRARSALDALAADDFAQVPRNHGYLNALCLSATLAIELEDRARAERLYTLLERYPRHETPNIVLLSAGPVSFYLGLLAAFLGLPEAVRHFTLTISLCEERGLRPMLARAKLELARCLTRGSDMASTAQAKEAQLSALVAAEALGMQWCAEEAQHLTS
jgi:hypothetical protein